MEDEALGLVIGSRERASRGLLFSQEASGQLRSAFPSIMEDTSLFSTIRFKKFHRLKHFVGIFI